MIINKVPFEIDFPLKILTSKKVKFEDKKTRERIFRRHVYYYKYGKIRNNLLEKNNQIFLDLAKKVKKFLKKEHPPIKVLNISVFGSSLYSKNNDDFDFLVIVKGNIFSYKKIKLSAIKNGKRINYPVGISIKGIENFTKGIFDSKSNVSLNLQSQIIYRTTISLFRRHIPLIGYDFVNNNKTFLKNGYAQVSDLLGNAYELYYLKNKSTKLSDGERSRKILSRVYEAISYMNFLDNSKEINIFRKKIFFKIEKAAKLPESKKFFDNVSLFYEKKTSIFRKNFRDKQEILSVLQDASLKDNIKKRLENYWRDVGLPYKWINQIIKILLKYHYNEDLAIKVIREKFPSIQNESSQDYSDKLKVFRRIKVKNLAKRIIKDIFGKIIVDVGGRTDDLVEQIIILNRKIKKAYVTDLYSSTTRSKNQKISFVVQPSSTKMPFSKNSVDTVILSMVLHHLTIKQQKAMIKNLRKYLKKDGMILLIEDTFPEKIDSNKYTKVIKNFLGFNILDKKRILYFYDWFGNRLMRNRDSIHLFYNYKTMEEWKEIFERYGMKQIKSEFIMENKAHPDIFPPKAIMIFQKR